MIGTAASTLGVGLAGTATALTGNTIGVRAVNNSPTGVAAQFDALGGGKIISGRTTGFVEKFAVASNGNVTAGGTVSGTQLISTVAPGTPPLSVASNTPVPNLNADLLDGYHASTFATLGSNIFTATQTLSSGDLNVAGGNIALPQTAGASAGVISLAGTSFIHACCSDVSNNTFVGRNAGNFTLTGSANTATGYQALHSNTTGHGNTASGYEALYSNTDGVDNTAHGYRALYHNTTGGYNTASGNYALYSNIDGNVNTASGDSALYSNTTGSHNTASGVHSLGLNTTGNANTASGHSALYSNTSGRDNTASGRGALYSNTTGSLNTASGSGALYSNTDGFANTAIGVDALARNCYGVSSDCLAHYNTALGFYAGVTPDLTSGNITGANNTFIGAFSGPGTSTNLTNATAIGAMAVVSQSNSLILGGTGSYAVNVGIGTAAPAATLDVVGNIQSSGSVTATSFVGPLSGIAADLECSGCVAEGELDFDPATQTELSAEATTRATTDTSLAASIDAHKTSGDHDSRYSLLQHDHAVARVSLTGQSAPIATTTLYTPSTSGLFLISTYLVTMIAGDAGFINLTVQHFDDYGLQTDVTNGLNASVLGTNNWWTGPKRAVAGQPITYSVAFDSVVGTPQYALFIVVQPL